MNTRKVSNTRGLFLTLALSLAALLPGCTDYQDEISALDARLETLEGLAGRVNDEVASLQALVEAMQAGDVITEVEEIPGADGSAAGYRLHFLRHGSIELMNGRDGADGRDGAAPLFSVAPYGDGIYCWQVSYDGGQSYRWVTDEAGGPVRAVGADGKDGRSVTPLLRVTGDFVWEVSYDGGGTWEALSDPLTGSPMSARGRDGEDAVTTFKEVVKVYDPDGVTVTGWRFTLQNGDTFTVSQFVAVQTVAVQRDGSNVTAPVVIPQGGGVALTAVAYPSSALYKDVVWHVQDGSSSDFAIESPYSATTLIRANTKGATARIRAVARYSQPGSPVVYGEVTVACD